MVLGLKKRNPRLSPSTHPKGADESRGANSVHTWFTREGLNLLFILAFVLAGAVLRDVNLLVLLGGIIIGMMLMQWRICHRSLLLISTRRQLPLSAQVAFPFDVKVQVTNRRKWLPAWLICVEEQVERVEPYPSRLPTGTTLVIPWVGAEQTRQSVYRCSLDFRGRYRFGPICITSSFPFGLMRSWCYQNNSKELIVHPKLGHLIGKWENLVRMDREGLAKTSSRAGVNEGEFYGLRHWQQGDSRRWIHWRTTARLNELAVRQFEQQQRLNMAILIDLWKPDAASDQEPIESIEKMISFTATLIDSLSRQGNHRIAVAVAGEQLRVSSRIQNRAVMNAVLDDLSIATAGANPDLSGAVEQMMPILADSHSLVVISNRSAQWDQLSMKRSSESRRLVLDRLQSRWLNVSAGDIDAYFRMDAP